MDVAHVAKLANLSISSSDETKFAKQFADTLKTVDQINKLETKDVPPTSQVTGLTNVTRPDIIDTSRMLTANQALSQASSTVNGFFRVPAILSAK